jgi:hypothetical protein
MPNPLKAVATRDSDTLALLGKKQVLKRRFGFWSLFGFAVCEREYPGDLHTRLEILDHSHPNAVIE